MKPHSIVEPALERAPEETMALPEISGSTTTARSLLRSLVADGNERIPTVNNPYRSWLPFRLEPSEVELAGHRTAEIRHQLAPMGFQAAGQVLSTLALPLVASAQLTDVQAESLVTHLAHKLADHPSSAVQSACGAHEERSPFFPKLSDLMPTISDEVGRLTLELSRLQRLLDFNKGDQELDHLEPGPVEPSDAAEVRRMVAELSQRLRSNKATDKRRDQIEQAKRDRLRRTQCRLGESIG